MDRAPPGYRPPGRNVLRTAPRQHASARVPPSRPALAQRAGMRTACALGGTCVLAVSSFGRQRTAAAAICSDGRFVAGAAQILSECRPQPWASAGTCGRRALPWKYVHFGAEATCVHARSDGCAGMVGFDVSRDTGHARGWANADSGRRGRGFDPRPAEKHLYKRVSALGMPVAAVCVAVHTGWVFRPKRGDGAWASR